MTNKLLQKVVTAHGGRSRWDKFVQASGHVRISGELWSALGGSPDYADARFELSTREQSVSASPIARGGMKYVFKPNVLVLENSEGEFTETQYNPRSSFPKTDDKSRWDDFQVAYICSYSVWNCVTQPFLFSYAGFQVEELPKIKTEAGIGETLAVRFPSTLITHSSDNLVSVGEDGLMLRQDFVFGVMNAPVTSVLESYADTQGIKLPMVRKMYRAEDLKSMGNDAPVLACLELLELEFQ